MDVSKILTELREEVQILEEAIETLEGLARLREGKPVLKRRGRPPGSKNSPHPVVGISAAID